MGEFIKPETIEKIMNPFKRAEKEMTKEEKIEYLCLGAEFGAFDSEKVGITREIYKMTSHIIIDDIEFLKSLTEEEIKQIRKALKLAQTYSETPINLDNESLEHE